jgi:hypothetical protein
VIERAVLEHQIDVRRDADRAIIAASRQELLERRHAGEPTDRLDRLAAVHRHRG